MATSKHHRAETRRIRKPGREPEPARDRREIVSELERLREECSLLDREEPGRVLPLKKIGGLLIELRSHERSDDDAETHPSEPRDPEIAAIDMEALETLGAHHTALKNYSAALECYFECVRMLERGDDPTMLGITWMEIGVLYGEMGKLDRALECFGESIEEFRKGNNYYLEIKAIVNVANILHAQGSCDVALTSLLRCLMVFEELGDREGIVESLAGIGGIYETMGDAAAALSYMNRAMAMLEPDENPALAGALLLGMSNLYHTGGEYDRALNAIEAAFAIAKRAGDEHLRARLHEIASHVYEQLGDPSLALHHHRLFVKLENEHRRSLQQSGVAEMEMRFEIERVRQERNAYRRQAQELRQEVYAKTRELTSLSLNLVRKSEFLEEMRRQLGQVIGSTQESSARIVKPLLDDLATTMKADNDWAPFEEQCNDLHKDFMRILAERYPTLTRTELKICALTRIDRSTKEIADILFVSVRSVQNHRYRIRKKFGLSPEANLLSFLVGL